MKSLKSLGLFAFLVFTFITSAAQKIISEGIIVYDVAILSADNTPQDKISLPDATSTVYLKGNNSRTDLVSPLGKEITIFNSKSDNAVVLKEFSGQKLMITLTKENWRTKNSANRDLKFELTGEVKNIAGVNAKKAVAVMNNGKSLIVYYSPELQPANKEYDVIFANLPGLALEYEIDMGKTKFKYTLSKISYDPVQVSLFDFPTSGYRIMTYNENQQLKRGS